MLVNITPVRANTLPLDSALTGTETMLIISNGILYRASVAQFALLVGSGPSAQTVLIPAGTPIPAPIIMNTVYSIYGPKASIIAEIPDVDDPTDTVLIEFKDIEIRRRYSDSSKTVLVSIDIYGHQDATGLLFNEDTYITIKP
jgi:hypothetical protein